MANMLQGMFSFVLYDGKKDIYFACRDNVGITTLYQGWKSSDKSVWFASEMKSLNCDCDKIIAFPPGKYFCSDDAKFVEYYKPEWYGDIAKGLPLPVDELKMNTPEQDMQMYLDIRNALEESVRMQLMSEVPYGVLLSGGLDSSLIASIAMRMRTNSGNEGAIKSNNMLN